VLLYFTPNYMTPTPSLSREQHSARRQEFFGGRSESMEQSSRYIATASVREYVFYAFFRFQKKSYF